MSPDGQNTTVERAMAPLTACAFRRMPACMAMISALKAFEGPLTFMAAHTHPDVPQNFEMLCFVKGNVVGMTTTLRSLNVDMASFPTLAWLCLRVSDDLSLPDMCPIRDTLVDLSLTGFRIKGDELSMLSLKHLRLKDVAVSGPLIAPATLKTLTVVGKDWKSLVAGDNLTGLRLFNESRDRCPVATLGGVESLVTLTCVAVRVHPYLMDICRRARGLVDLEVGSPLKVQWDSLLLAAFTCPNLKGVIMCQTAAGVCPHLLKMWAACKAGDVDAPFGLRGLCAYLVHSDKVEVLVRWKLT